MKWLFLIIVVLVNMIIGSVPMYLIIWMKQSPYWACIYLVWVLIWIQVFELAGAFRKEGGHG